MGGREGEWKQQVPIWIYEMRQGRAGQTQSKCTRRGGGEEESHSNPDVWIGGEGGGKRSPARSGHSGVGPRPVLIPPHCNSPDNIGVGCLGKAGVFSPVEELHRLDVMALRVRG